MRRKTIITIGIILIALAIIAGIVVVLIERKNSQIPEQVKPETTESADTDTPEATHGGTSTETETVTGFEEIEKTENLAYKLNDDGSGYTVTGIGTCTDKDVIIPETYRGKPVVAIGEGAFAGVTLETISFAKNIKSIVCPSHCSCGAGAAETYHGFLRCTVWMFHPGAADSGAGSADQAGISRTGVLCPEACGTQRQNFQNV